MRARSSKELNSNVAQPHTKKQKTRLSFGRATSSRLPPFLLGKRKAGFSERAQQTSDSKRTVDRHCISSVQAPLLAPSEDKDKGRIGRIRWRSAEKEFQREMQRTATGGALFG